MNSPVAMVMTIVMSEPMITVGSVARTRGEGLGDAMDQITTPLGRRRSRVLCNYSIAEQKLWNRFQKLVLCMNSPNEHEADNAYELAKQWLIQHNLHWDDS
jgi:hypothetical protein